MLRIPQEIQLAIASSGGRATGKALRCTHSRLEAAGNTEVFKSITIDFGNPKSIVNANEFALSRLVQNLECLDIKVRATHSNANNIAVWMERWIGIKNFITLSIDRSLKFRKVIIRFDQSYTHWSGIFVDHVIDTITKTLPNDSSQRNTGKFHVRLEGLRVYHVKELCDQFGHVGTRKDWLNCCGWSLQAELPECFPGDVEKWQEFLRLYQRLRSFEVNVGSRVNPVHLKQILHYLPVSNAACITIRASKRTFRNLQANLPAHLMQRLITQG